MDAQVGRVLDELERLGLAQQTVVIFLGDNGYKLGDHAAWTQTTNVRLDTRIPLIIRAPGLAPAGRHAEGMVEVVDVYPTLLDLFGLAGPAHLEGRSFLAQLCRPELPGKSAVFTQSPQRDGEREVMGYSMITGTHRVTRWVDRAEPGREVAVELYDHRADPGETRNLAADPVAAGVRRELLAWLAAGWRGADARDAAGGR